eukprot:g8204.t1
MRRRWRVVGGTSSGGLLVREGAELTAKALPNRLATGAVVEEEKIVGVTHGDDFVASSGGYDRLSYRKLLGAGPELGWVSLQANGVPLLQLLPPAPDLPRARTLRRRGEDEAPGSPAWVEETRYREIASIRFILDAPCEEVAVALSAALHGAPGRIDMQREIFAAGQLQLRDPPEQEQTGLPLPVPMSPQWRETAFATTDFSEETVWNGSVGNSSASFSLGLRPLWSDELCTYQEEASELEAPASGEHLELQTVGRSPAFEFSCPRRIRSVIRVTEETCEHPQKLFHLQVLCSRIKEAIKLSFDETQREALGLAASFADLDLTLLRSHEHTDQQELEQLVPHCKNEIGKKQGQFTEGSVDVVSFAELLQRICRRADPQADIYRSFADLGSGRGHAVLAAHALSSLRGGRGRRRWKTSEAKSSMNPLKLLEASDFLHPISSSHWTSASVVFANGVTWPSELLAEIGQLALKLKKGAVLVLVARRLPADDLELLQRFDVRGDACLLSFTDKKAVQVWIYQRR